MAEIPDEEHQIEEQDIEILVDALRQSFLSKRARYYIAGHQDILFIEIEGLEELSEEEIAEVAQPILEELDLEFEEISLLPLTN
ncbi:MAG TPA: hypothetical protein VE868_05460 [Balneolaceae bacterium]|nr:hypothetical protein [Balneolaceae bacterium]